MEKDIKFTEKKQTAERPAEPTLDNIPPEYKITRFPNGAPFAYKPHPETPGKTIIFDGSGTVVGITHRLEVADLLCRGAQCLLELLAFQAAEEKAQASAAETAKTALNIIEIGEAAKPEFREGLRDGDDDNNPPDQPETQNHN